MFRLGHQEPPRIPPGNAAPRRAIVPAEKLEQPFAWVQLPRPDAEARRSPSGLIQPAAERTVSLFAEEPRIEELLHGGTAVLWIEIPQPLDLPSRETQS